jgi:hypothetical protein
MERPVAALYDANILYFAPIRDLFSIPMLFCFTFLTWPPALFAPRSDSNGQVCTIREFINLL